MSDTEVRGYSNHEDAELMERDMSIVERGGYVNKQLIG